MKAMPWIKQYPSRLHDMRLAQLSERQQLRYYQLYLLAGHLNADGAFTQDDKQLTPKEIAFFLRVKDADQLAKDIQALKKCGLLKMNGHGPYIAEFKDEQINWMERQRDNRERQKRFQKSRKDNALVTRDDDVSSASITPLEKEEESEKESDSESDKEKKRTGTSSPLLNEALNQLSRAKITVTEKDKTALSSISIRGEWIPKAIGIALKSNKHSAAYVIGILRNWRDEYANNGKCNKQGADKSAPSRRQTPDTSAATRAAAKRIIERKRKSNV